MPHCVKHCGSNYKECKISKTCLLCYSLFPTQIVLLGTISVINSKTHSLQFEN